MEGLKRNPSPEHGLELNEIAANVFISRGEFKKALRHADAEVEAARLLNDTELLAGCYLTLGQVFARMERFSAAANAWREVCHLAKIAKNRDMEGKAFYNLAHLDQHRGYHERSLDVLDKAHQCFKETENLEGLANCFSSKSNAYMEMEDFDKALAALDRLESLTNELNNVRLKAITFFRKGAIHLEKDEREESIHPMTQALRLFRQLDDRKNVVLVASNIVRTYLYLGQLKKAAELLEEMRELSKKIDSEMLKCKVKFVHAEAAAHEGNAETAVSFCKEGFEISKMIDRKEGFLEFHKTLKEVFKKIDLDIPGVEHLIMRAQSSYVRHGLTEEFKQANKWLTRLARFNRK